MQKQKNNTPGQTMPAPDLIPNTHILYLELDINKTEKRFKQYVKEYNRALHDPVFLQQQYALHKHYKVNVQASIKSLAIKNTHILTAIQIIKAYYQYLKLVERGQIIKDPEFAMNNVGLATMTGMSDRSSRRHVNKLLATGFLQEKTFRGSNTSFLLKITPEFLVARPQKELSELLLRQYIAQYPASPISPVTLKYYRTLRPSFADFPEGIIRTICPHVEITPETYNNNILAKGIVDNSTGTKSKHPQKLTVINNAIQDSGETGNPDKQYPEQTNVRLGQNQTETYQQKIHRDHKKNVPAASFKSIFLYTDLAWNFARSILYKNYNIQPQQEQTVKHYIAGIFLEYIKNNDPKKLAQCYNEFVTTIQIVHDYTQRKIEWQLARPEYFFDPKFTGGFKRALTEWLPKHKTRQKIKKDWNSNKKLVGNLYRYYAKKPSYERYRQCTQRLGKLKNKKFLDIFNACVLDENKYNPEFLNTQQENRA